MRSLNQLHHLKVPSCFALLLGLSCAMMSARGLAAETVIYAPTTVPASKIEKKVSEAVGEKAHAFSKLNDFEAGISVVKPEIVVSTEAFAEETTQFEKIGPAKVNGSTSSKYILLALDESWKKKLGQARVGAVEFIKRGRIKDYFQKVFKSDFKSVKTVSKVEDLFPLLVFRQVDVIALQPSTYAELKEKFNTPVVEVSSSSEIQALSIYRRTGASVGDFLEKLKSLDFNFKDWGKE